MFPAMRNAGPRSGTSSSPGPIGTDGAVCLHRAVSAVTVRSVDAPLLGGAGVVSVGLFRKLEPPGIDGFLVVFVLLIELLFEPTVTFGMGSDMRFSR